MKRLLLLSFIVLTACTTTQPGSSTLITPIIDHPARPLPVVLKNPNWQVVTKNNLSTVTAQAASAQGTANPVFVILTPDDFKVMMTNLAELKRYIDQQTGIIVYYEKATSAPTTATKPKASSSSPSWP